ncbi:MAG: hypothetical protein IJY31_06480 [Muribaculaceae bacterium]|nr:hypothetical protein [Muribaculaceae bacterium]
MNRARLIITFLTCTVITGAVMGIYFFMQKAEVHGIRLSRERYPVCGIDISAHNGVIDFSRMRADSIDFVIIKATEGTSFKDSRFSDNYRKARASGLKVGAYHFFRFDTDGMMQAINFINSVSRLPLDFPLMIDIEEWNNAKGISSEMILSRLKTMLAHLEHSGYNIILYSNKDGHKRFIRNAFDNFPLWICSFTDPPTTSEWVFWQYSHRGNVDGIDGNVDINTFNGNRQQWLFWLSNHPTKTQ